MTELRPVRELVEFYIGGGWGSDLPSEGLEEVAIIRGADFPRVAAGDSRAVPVRWEDSKKVARRALREGDLVLEISGGTKDRPTGRSVFVSERIVQAHRVPVIPASFCRLLRPDSTQVAPRYLYYWLQDMYRDGRTWGYQVQSTGLANFNVEWFLDRELVRVPPVDEQRRIAEVLGAIDDLIDTNERLHDQLLEQAFSLFAARAQGAGVVELRELGAEASRGVTPKYDTSPDSVVVVNQKCIRGFRVDLNVARRMTPRSVRPEKIAEPGDTLVNSTGTGTLGRASRWMGSTAVHVDSHVTVVKSPNRRESAYLSYALMSQTEAIESLAEGSTGQTELSRDRLLSLPVPNLLSVERVALSQALDELDVARVGLLTENKQLRRTRDELLPLLMSGAVRVRPEGVAA